MTCNELSSLIIQNRDSIAFLVGNGIHNYEIGVKGAKDKLSWKDLLEKNNKNHGDRYLIRSDKMHNQNIGIAPKRIPFK
jgi:hypothetical protein